MTVLWCRRTIQLIGVKFLGYSDTRFYVYVHKYASGPKCGQVFYVGKGRYGRSIDRRSRNPHWKNIVNKYGHTVEILARFHIEECAFSFERALIAFYGRENLCNLSDGGEGCSGVKRSEKTKRKLSKSKIGKILSDDHKESIRRKTQSKKHRNKLSSILLSDGVREKLVKSANRQFETEDKKAKHTKACGGLPVKRSDGVIFFSASEAARKTSEYLGRKCNAQNISRAASIDRYNAFGFGWEFTSWDDYDMNVIEPIERKEP